MVTRIAIKAYLFHNFLVEQEKNPNEIRYVFVGFEHKFLRRLTSLIRSEFGISIDLIDAGRGYGDVIDSRAISRPVILNVTKSRAGEFASLLTFKTFTNEFELPFQRSISETARAFNLYDVSNWVLALDHLEKIIKIHFPHAKDKTVLNITVFLKNLWRYAQRRAPGLKYLLSPDAIIKALLTLNTDSFNLNLVAEALGFDPSLNLVSCEKLEKSMDTFLRKSDRVRRRFLKGTFLEQRRRLARLLENLVRGFLSLLAQNPPLCKTKNIKGIEKITELFEKIENRRRIYGVIPRNIKILRYSSSSMLPKSVAFGIQRRPTEQYATSKFLPHLWNDVIEDFSKSKGFSKPPLNLSVNDSDTITITFNSLEGYDFALQRWRR
jgi:hypothetical protein